VSTSFTTRAQTRAKSIAAKSLGVNAESHALASTGGWIPE